MLDIYAFIQAAEEGNIEELKRLISLNPTEIENMLRANTFAAFRLAVEGGHLAVMKYLLSLAPECVQKMVRADNFAAFREAARGGHLEVMECLVALAGDGVQEMVAADNFLAFRWAAENGHLEVIKYLMSLAPDSVQEMLAADDFAAFRFAALNGHLEVMEYLVALAPESVQDMVHSRNFAAFRYAAQNGHLAVMEYLMSLAPDSVQEMVAADTFAAFCEAAQNGHLAVMNKLMSFPAVFAYAEMHVREYGPRVQAFMQQRLAHLAQEMEAFQVSHPDELFDISDLEQAKLYFYMMRNLIRHRTADSLTQLNRLLSIPTVKALAHQAVTPHQSNELLRLAMSLNNSEAARLLLTIPAVRNLAQENNFYREEQRHGLDLRAIAQDRESSMRSLTQGEQQALQRVQIEYEPQIRTRGVPHIMADLKQLLARRYAANPASVQTEDGREIALPLAFDAFQAVARTLAPNIRERALQSYYKHPDHTALRYLSKPNHWMSPNAAYVNRSEVGAWSTFVDYQDLIALMYLAAKDETSEAINGYTIETRLENFIQELALIGRAHNWDSTRINSRTGQAEQFDDLQADKPSCFSGVKKRLFQSVQGHQLLTLLTEDIIDLEVRAVVRAHFISCINDENCVALDNAWQAIIDGNEPDLSILAQFNFSQEELDGHLASISAMLTEKYGSGFDEALKAHLFTRINVSLPFRSLVEKFGGEINLQRILEGKKQAKENKRNNFLVFFAAGAVVMGTGMLFSPHAQSVIANLFSFMPHVAAIVAAVLIFAAAYALLGSLIETTVIYFVNKETSVVLN